MTTGPVTREGVDLPIRSSMGGALWGEQDLDGTAMVRLADERMYADKARGMLRS